jgi:hypothetical protein
MHRKLTENRAYAQRMFRIRSLTVEPVLGTLINFLNMKRVNTRGIQSANKHVLIAALTYNLKKYMKFIGKKAVSQAIDLRKEVEIVFLPLLPIFGSFLTLLSHCLWIMKTLKAQTI